MVNGKTFKLTHAVAYEAKIADEPGIAVIASDRLIDAAKIKASLKENDGSDEDVSLSQPHVKFVFDKSGAIGSCSIYAAGFSFGTNNSEKMSGELKLENSRATGKANLARQGEGEYERSGELTFSLGLLGSAAEQEQKAAPLAKLGVLGKFLGNGKQAKLAFVSAYPREAFADQPSLTIVMTEKDHSRDKKPDFKAGFGDYGNALVISCHEDGSIFGCEISHAAHAKRGFSSVGNIQFVEFQIAGGQVQGKLQTDGEQEFFGDTWTIDLNLAAKYTAQKPAASDPPKTAATDKLATKPVPEPNEPEPKRPVAAALKANELALPKDATDIEYKKLVEHISCKSPTDYKTLAGQYAKLLAEQGWQTDGRDLVGVSAILKRKRGEASLTIFLKPDGTGSTVTMFTEGLAWDE
jgi:hypothetical protein